MPSVGDLKNLIESKRFAKKQSTEFQMDCVGMNLSANSDNKQSVSLREPDAQKRPILMEKGEKM